MHGEMRGFFEGLAGGKYALPEDGEAVVKAAWSLLTEMQGRVCLPDIAAGMAGAGSRAWSSAEMEEAVEAASLAPVATQMIALCFWNLADVALTDGEGFYDEESAITLKMLHDCLALCGFAWSKDEYAQILDGTSPLYAENMEFADDVTLESEPADGMDDGEEGWAPMPGGADGEGASDELNEAA